MTQPPPLVSRHDTWVSVDPILGCPADCSYCYLHQRGLTRQSPRIRATIDGVVAAIAAHFERFGRTWGRPATPAPLAIGNYTDVFMSLHGIDFAARLCGELPRHFPGHPIVLITKSPLARQAIDCFKNPAAPLLLFLSQSFACESPVPEVEKGKTASVAQTLAAAEAARVAGIVPVHFWRPFSPILNPPERLCGRIEQLRGSGFSASVIVGLKACGGALSEDATNQLLRAGTDEAAHNESVTEELLKAALDHGKQRGYPLYRHSSCAIAHALGLAESLGTWRPGLSEGYCAPCSCPAAQRERCARRQAGAEEPGPEILQMVRAITSAEDVAWDSGQSRIRVSCTLPQDEACALSHKIGYRIEPATMLATRAWRGSI